MNFLDYAKRSMKSIKHHDSKELALADWALGLVGEAAEFAELRLGKCDPMTVAKEAGDILWYSMALIRELQDGREMTEVEHGYQADDSNWPYRCMDGMEASEKLELMCQAGSIAEDIKHVIAHKAKLEPKDIVKKVYKLQATLAGILWECWETEPIYVAELNILKLEHRYKDTEGEYNHASSATRHDAEEKFSDTADYKRLEQLICG